jgi:hypothetical protein
MTQAPDVEAQILVRSRGGVYRKLVISRDRIVGAVLVGDVSEAGPIAMLIRRGLKLSEFKRFDPSRPIRYAELALPWGVRVGGPAAALVGGDSPRPGSATA